MTIPIEEERILEVVKLFKKLKIRHCLHGAFAVYYWGEPRASGDVDFIVLIPPRFDEFIKYAEGKGWKVIPLEEKTVLEFPDTHLFFEFWHARSDFDSESLDKSENRKVKLFSERERTLSIIAAENLIIYKLDRWNYRDRADILSILNRQGTKLDREYLWTWVVRKRQLIRRFKEAASKSIHKDWLLQGRWPKI